MSERDTTLSSALAAYAEVTSGEALDAALLRSRILQSVGAPRRRSLRRLSFALPLVAVFAVSAAFAATQPHWRAAIRDRFDSLLGGTAAASRQTPQRREPRRASKATAAAPAASASTEPSHDAEAPIAVDALPLAPPASSGRSATSSGAAQPQVKVAALAPAPNTASEASAELEAYRTAHRIHFDGGTPAASLAAWDRYLIDFPAGSFADDARFNRALCLIRLGRLTDARSALTPFAAAPPGSYRQTEAASLLQGLGAGLHSSE